MTGIYMPLWKQQNVRGCSCCAVGNPNAISGNDIEKLKQNRDSSMERHALPKEFMVPQLRKMQGASPDDIPGVRKNLQKLKDMQTKLRMRLEDLDLTMEQHDDLL
ncbi:hypothetical protein ETB97_004806 [Aspergillus alliaceus]|uniref:Uncharacterized protein n=1 Tax=Petromyces alliaceus TaxID=209559 RepID=A0A8H6AB15_PETAA|nr:hypothetical protein ETB97_004806 [Aspergillus burnettii]